MKIKILSNAVVIDSEVNADALRTAIDKCPRAAELMDEEGNVTFMMRADNTNRKSPFSAYGINWNAIHGKNAAIKVMYEDLPENEIKRFVAEQIAKYGNMPEKVLENVMKAYADYEKCVDKVEEKIEVL